jgi:hypothetical protein
VPAPEGLIADAVVTTPNATWGRVQRGIGGAIGILPATLGGLTTTLGGIDPTIAPEIDGASPAYAAAADAGGKIAYAIGVKLVDPRHARAALLDGEASRYSAREVGELTELTPKTGVPPPTSIALARGGWLVVASSPPDLERLAPYTTRTLPTRLAPPSAIAIDFPKSALAGPVRAHLTAWWDGLRAELDGADQKMRAKHGGRAPDFGDAPAVLGVLDGVVKPRLAALGDFERAHVALDAGDAEVHAVVTLTPAVGGGPATKLVQAVRTGDAAPLMDFAADAPALLLMRDDAAARVDDAAALADAATRVLGARASEDDGKKLRVALDDWAKGRGDWFGLGLAWGPPGLIVRAPAANPELAVRAVREALDLTTVAGFKEPLQSLLGVQGVSFADEAAAGARAHIATFARDKSSAKLGVAWAVLGGEVRVVAGESPAQMLAPPPRKLADEPTVTSYLAALETNASVVLVAQPLRLDPKRSALPAAPLVCAAGRAGADAWVRVQIADALLREMSKSQMGL